MSVNNNFNMYTKFYTRSPHLSSVNPKLNSLTKQNRKTTPSPISLTQKKPKKLNLPYNILTKQNNKKQHLTSLTMTNKSNSLNNSHVNNISLNDSGINKLNNITTSKKLIQNRRAKTPIIPQKSPSKLNWSSLSTRASPNLNTKIIKKITKNSNTSRISLPNSSFLSKLNFMKLNNNHRKIQQRNFQGKNIFSQFRPKQTTTVVIANEAIKMNNTSMNNINKTFYAHKGNIPSPFDKETSTSSESSNNQKFIQDKSKEVIHKEVKIFFIFYIGSAISSKER